MNDTPAPQPSNLEQAAPKAHPWSTLEPEHFQLLRLTPLPALRGSGTRPLQFLRLGRVERHRETQSMLRLTLQLPGQRVHKEQNLFEVWADHRSREVRFGVDRGLLIEPQNRGLGRFLLAQGIAWAQRRWANYQVEGGALAAKEVANEDARQRRDHFLRAQGFDVSYLDQQLLKAQYGAATVGDLRSEWNQDKVQIVDLLDAAAMLQLADQTLREQDVKLRKLQERIATLSREDGTLRFTIFCLVAFTMFQAGLLVWIATR